MGPSGWVRGLRLRRASSGFGSLSDLLLGIPAGSGFENPGLRISVEPLRLVVEFVFR